MPAHQCVVLVPLNWHERPEAPTANTHTYSIKPPNMDRDAASACSIVDDYGNELCDIWDGDEGHRIQRTCHVLGKSVYLNGKLLQQAMFPGETVRDSHLLQIGDTVIIKTTSSQTGYTFAWKGRDRLPRPGRREYTKFTKDSFDYDEARGLFSFSKSTGLPQRFRFGVGIRDIFFLAVPVPTDLCGMTLFPRFCVQEDSSGVMAAFEKTEYSCSKGIITPDNAFEHICCDIVNFLSLSESCKGVNPALFVSEIRHAGRVENDTCLLCRALQVRAEASAIDTPYWSVFHFARHVLRLRAHPQVDPTTNTIYKWRGSSSEAVHFRNLQCYLFMDGANDRRVSITARYSNGLFSVKVLDSSEEIYNVAQAYLRMDTEQEQSLEPTFPKCTTVYAKPTELIRVCRGFCGDRKGLLTFNLTSAEEPTSSTGLTQGDLIVAVEGLRLAYGDRGEKSLATFLDVISTMALGRWKDTKLALTVLRSPYSTQDCNNALCLPFNMSEVIQYAAARRTISCKTRDEESPAVRGDPKPPRQVKIEPGLAVPTPAFPHAKTSASLRWSNFGARPSCR
jgi:hypothetical protein